MALDYDSGQRFFFQDHKCTRFLASSFTPRFLALLVLLATFKGTTISISTSAVK